MISKPAPFSRRLFAGLLLSVTLVPVTAVRAQGGVDPRVPPNATPLPGGGAAYSFPARPDEPATAPDPQDRGLVTSGFGTLAGATVGASDDRENTEPTSWYVYENQTTADILNTATTNNLRVVDLSVQTAGSSPVFSAVYVANTQTYAKTWWFLVNVTPADLLTFVTTNNARIVSMKTVDDPAATVRFYAVMISNTGADAKTWYFYQGQTTAQLTTLWQNNNARIVQITSHVKSGVTLYDAVMISNTGADARTWFWYVNATVPDISAHLTANNARLVDLDLDPTTGNYNVIMNSCSGGCPAWWWYVNVPTSTLISTATGNGARLIDVNTTAGCSDRCWSILLIDNSHITISGNAGVAGATVTYTGGSTVADGAGNWAFTVTSPWSGTVVPSRPGYRFTPASRSYSGQGGSLISQNFTAALVHARSDFDGDGKADVSVFRPTDGSWWILGSSAGFSSRQWGQNGDVPVAADFDGDGKADLAVFRPSNGTWWILGSSAGFSSRQWGQNGDVPVVADYDGDGKADLAVFRPSSGTWWILGSSAGFSSRQWGQNGDIPVAADFDGDGKADLAVFRPSNGTWWILGSSAGFSSRQWGQNGDVPVVADVDGDGIADIAVFRPVDGTWWVLQSQAGFMARQWGQNGDIPVPADYDGDGKTDLAIYRPSQGAWYILKSSNGGLQVANWGLPTDVPVPSIR
jgi:hypothetical protein